MKIKKFNENADNLEDLVYDIYTIIDDNVEYDYIEYHITSDSKLKAARKIIKDLIEKGINFELLKNTEKYNL